MNCRWFVSTYIVYCEKETRFIAFLWPVYQHFHSLLLVLFWYFFLIQVFLLHLHIFLLLFLNHALSLILFENWKSFHFLAIFISRLYTILFVVVSAAFRAIFFLHTSLRKMVKNYTLSVFRYFFNSLFCYSVSIIFCWVSSILN